ncbi:hypothetical protein UQW22_09705 [Isoptericola halotolerans]|uniref:hypothetical protein n=1 Tax=Isoptericola halotolerans TaxID=300560 RepID=UPI00388FA63F
MRVNAYVLVADPNFLGASLSAYYDHVDRIVLSYDETATSWTGTPLPVDECLAIVKEVDVDGKCVHSPGRYARLDHDPLDNDTFQRQAALDEASGGADWVLQLDTDEVMTDPDVFFTALHRAEGTGTSALAYPSRWLYSRVAAGRYLEASTRLGRPVASFPGPLAVRAGTRLELARQTTCPTYRVDLRPWNTDPHQHQETPVHQVVAPHEAVLHFSWVRDPDTMRRKFGWSGHTAMYSDPAVFRRWASRSARPRATAATSLLRRRDWYRLVTVPEPPGGAPWA